MKKVLLASALLFAAASVHAEYKDVIGFKMTGECSFGEYMEVVADFNTWAKSRGYQAQIFMPHDSDDLETYYWVGTSADLATFGAAHDEWLNGVMSAGSEPAKLMDRFSKCSSNQTRRSYYAF